MVNIKLNDPNLEENYKALQVLKATGLYTEEELQKIYDRQVAKDAFIAPSKKSNGEELTIVKENFQKAVEEGEIK